MGEGSGGKGRKTKTKQIPAPPPCMRFGAGIHRGSPFDPAFLFSLAGHWLLVSFAPGWFHPPSPIVREAKTSLASGTAPHAQPNGNAGERFFYSLLPSRSCFVSLLVLRAGTPGRMRGMRGSRHCGLGVLGSGLSNWRIGDFSPFLNLPPTSELAIGGGFRFY